MKCKFPNSYNMKVGEQNNCSRIDDTGAIYLFFLSKSIGGNAKGSFLFTHQL